MNDRVAQRLNEDYDDANQLWYKCVGSAFEYLCSDFEATQTKVITGKRLFAEKLGNELGSQVVADGFYHGYNIKIEKSGYYILTLSNIYGVSQISVFIDGIKKDFEISECGDVLMEFNGLGCSEIFVGFLNSEGYTNYGKNCNTCSVTCSDVSTVTPMIQNGDKIDPPFIMNVSAVCDLRPYIMAQMNAFKMPLLFRAGMDLHNYVTTSNRANYESLGFGSDDVYMYFENEYKKYLKLAADKFTPDCDVCYKVKTSIQYISSIP
jgi:hypothetical protein